MAIFDTRYRADVIKPNKNRGIGVASSHNVTLRLGITSRRFHGVNKLSSILKVITFIDMNSNICAYLRRNSRHTNLFLLEDLRKSKSNTDVVFHDCYLRAFVLVTRLERVDKSYHLQLLTTYDLPHRYRDRSREATLSKQIASALRLLVRQDLHSPHSFSRSTDDSSGSSLISSRA